jgi:hypothetical protein
VSDVPPSPKRSLETAFWVALFLPFGLILLTVVVAGAKAAQDGLVLMLFPLGLALLICPLYCGIRLAVQWTGHPVARVFLGLVLVAGLGVFYLSVALAGCTLLL